MHWILSLLTGVMMTVSGFFGIHQAQTPLLGAYNPTGGGTYRLQSSIGTSDTSLTLTSFKEPVSNIAYTMSYLNSSIEYATLDPQTTTKEFISFSGITQNADGTATLTGVTRGLGFSYPYTASSTLQQAHSAQSILILSNPPQLTNQYANKNNTETITGVWAYSASPTVPTPVGLTDAVNKAYVDGGILAGAATSTESTTGIVRLATKVQQASSTPTTANTPYVIQAQNATSTYNGGAAGGNGLNVVVTRNDNTIDPNFISTTTATSYTFGGPITFQTSTTTLSATTSVAATAQNPLRLNGLNFNFQSTRAASSTVWMEDGSGNLTSELLDWQLLAETGTVNGVSTTTLSIPSRRAYKIMYMATSTATPTGGGNVYMQFNSVTSGAAYGWSVVYSTGPATSSGTPSSVIALTTNGSEAGGNGISGTVNVSNDTTVSSVMQLTGSAVSGDGSANFQSGGVFRSSVPITSVSLGLGGATSGTGTLVTGTYIRVYGTAR